MNRLLFHPYGVWQRRLFTSFLMWVAIFSVDTRAGEVDTRAGEVDTRAGEVDTRAGEVDARAVDARAVDARAVDARAVDARAVDARAVDTRAVDARAVESEGEPSRSQKDFAPYCGLHSLYGALRFLGKEISFAELTKPEYVGSWRGSSMSDLIRAAQDHGLQAMPMARMTCGMLRQAPCPVILHVKPQHSATQYNHWVLFMGFKNGTAQIYDGNQLIHESCVSLTSRWDRTGLLISRGPIDLNSMHRASVAWFSLYTGLVLIAINGGYWLQTRRVLVPGNSSRSKLGHMLLQATGVLIATTVTLFAFRLLHDSGFLSEPRAVAGLKDFHFVQFLPKLDAARVAARVAEGGTVLIDARWKQDYDDGHITGARNLEPSTPVEVCVDKLKDIPKRTPIIVYCTIEGCSYSGDIARRLEQAGYHNLSLFPGGWAEWTNFQESKSQEDHPIAGR